MKSGGVRTFTVRGLPVVRPHIYVTCGQIVPFGFTSLGELLRQITGESLN